MNHRIQTMPNPEPTWARMSGRIETNSSETETRSLFYYHSSPTLRTIKHSNLKGTRFIQRNPLWRDLPSRGTARCATMSRKTRKRKKKIASGTAVQRGRCGRSRGSKIDLAPCSRRFDRDSMRAPRPSQPFLIRAGDRKCSLLIGRDLKCVALALTATTRACGSRLAHFFRATVPRRDVAPDSERSHVENSRSRDRARRRRGAASDWRDLSPLSYLLSTNPAALKRVRTQGMLLHYIINIYIYIIIRHTCESVEFCHLGNSCAIFFETTSVRRFQDRKDPELVQNRRAQLRDDKSRDQNITRDRDLWKRCGNRR